MLEDLHWGDAPSIAYLGDALRALAAKPFMVLVLARPEIHERFPRLWSDTEKLDLALGRLSPRAAERLVRAALGDRFADDVIARIVERADGNAFYLEELIRHVAEGDPEGLPETVLALVQSRLDRLSPQDRRIVRAASVFGETFWLGGVASLLVPDMEGDVVEARLQSLASNEVIVLSDESRFVSEQQLAFRHGLLRDAAYAMLTDEDRAIGHRLAGDWLEQKGEKDALTLADHFELGGEPKRAVPWLVHATQTEIDGDDVEATITLSDRGMACGAEHVHRGALGMMRAAALFKRGDLLRSVECGREAMEFLPVGSPWWFLSAANVLFVGAFLRRSRPRGSGSPSNPDSADRADTIGALRLGDSEHLHWPHSHWSGPTGEFSARASRSDAKR